MEVDLSALKDILASLEQSIGGAQSSGKATEAKDADEEGESQKSEESDVDASSQDISAEFGGTSESDYHRLFEAKLSKCNQQLAKPLSDRNIKLIKSVQRFLKNDLQQSFV